MELALNFRRTISFFVAVFLSAAISGCTDKPADKPVPKSDEKKVASAEATKEKADATATSPEKTNDEKATSTENRSSAALGNNDAPDIQVMRDTIIAELICPTNPNSTFDNPNGSSSSKPKSEEITAETKKTDRKEEKKAEEKPLADTETNKSEAKEAEDSEEKDESGAQRMTDEEIAASNAERKMAAFKAIIEKLGPRLVDNADKLTKAHPLFPVWIDKQNKQVVLQGTICQTNAPLEMFAVPTGTKEHEAIVAIPTEAYVVHAALIVVGAKPGKPVQFGPQPNDYKPATGTPVEITVKWKNDKGEIQSARAQEWIKNVKTGKEMKESWVFGGSGFWKDEQTGIEYYKAEGGDFICVSNFPSAMLDLPIESSQSNENLMFQGYADRIPPRGTPVTIILKPQLPAETDKSAPEGTKTEAKKEEVKSDGPKGEEKSEAKQSESAK